MKKIILLLAFAFTSVVTSAQWIAQPTGTLEDFYSIQVINPNICYAVTFNGNLYKTINGGSSWNVVNTSQPITSFKFIDANTGFGLRDSIVFKTVNGGNVWLPLDTIHGEVVLNSINVLSPTILYMKAIPFNTADSIYVYKSTNGGLLWNKTAAFFGFNNNEKSFYFTDANTGFLSIDFNGEFFKTTNGGTTWSSQFSGGFSVATAFNFPTATIGYAPTENVEIMKTTDGGDTWNAISTVLPFPLYDVFFVSADTGYAVGSDGLMNGGILKTVNGGSSWAFSLNLNRFYTCIDMLNPNLGFACAMGGYIYKYDPTSSTEDFNSDDSELIVYPNPASSKITIESNNTQNGTLNITTILGQIILTEQYNTSKTQIDVSQLPSGIYILQLQSKNGLSTKKFVKE